MSPIPRPAGDVPRLLARRILPRALYRKVHHVLNAAAGVRSLGLREYRRLRDASPAAPASDGLIRIRVPGLLHPFHIRPNRTDRVTFMQNVVRQTYGRHLPDRPPRLIIDAGACIGDTTAWYLSRFPNARVVAIEPVERHLEVLRRNVGPYGERVTVIHGALWTTDEPVELSPLRRGRASFVESATGREDARLCPGLSPLTLLSATGEERIGIFKIDIEGAETQLFTGTACDAWLERTDAVYIEVHGPEAERVVLDAMQRNGFTGRRHRELYIFRKLA